MSTKSDARQKAEDTFECMLELGAGPAVACEATISPDAFSLRPARSKLLHLASRQVSGLDVGQTDIKLSTFIGEIRLYMFGRRFDRASELIARWFEKGKLADSIMPEKPEEVFEDACYEVSRKGKRAGTIRLYSTFSSVTDAKNGRTKRIPHSYIRDILDEGLSVNIRMLKGPDIALSMLGRRKDTLIRRLIELKSGLSRNLADAIAPMLGRSGEDMKDAIATYLPDGRGIAIEALRGKAPELAEAFDALLSSSRLAPILKMADEAAVGVKKGLMGDLDGDYIWVVFKLGLTAVFDVISINEEASRAAYAFACEAGSFTNFVEELSWSLTSIGFRREPLYLSDETLRQPGYESYLQALEDVPELKKLRGQLKARVSHTADGSWVERIAKISGKAVD